MKNAKVEIKSPFDKTGEAEQNTQPQLNEIKSEHSIAGGGFNFQPRVKPEGKTRRVNAVFQPSVYDKFAQIAKSNGYSVNDLLHQLVENFIQSQGS